MAEFDASDAHVPDTTLARVFWLDLIDPVTGDVTTLDVGDAPVADNGQTITFTWDDKGFIDLSRVES